MSLVNFPIRGRRATDTSSQAPNEPTSGGDGGSGMEARMAKLESDVGHIQSDIGEIKSDIRLLLKLYIAGFLLLGGLIAHGFKWF